MSKNSKARRAEAWQRRQPLHQQVVVGHKQEVDKVTGKAVSVPIYTVKASWDDPKIVRDEVRRIDEEIDETDRRVNHFNAEIEELTALLRDGPARLAKLTALVNKEAGRQEKLRAKRADTLLRLGGALVDQDVKRLEAKLKETARLLADMRDGKMSREKPVVTHRAESHRVDCSIGDTVALPYTGEKETNGVAGVDPRVAAAELRRKLSRRE